MRTTLALDDELVAKAQQFTGLQEKSALVREALRALIERESARRPARLAAASPIWRRYLAGDSEPRDPRRHLGLDRPSACGRQGAGASARNRASAGASLRDRRTGARQFASAPTDTGSAARPALCNGGHRRQSARFHRPTTG
ncbi:type II toxin-antitoxin system VapB family antitoxin [Luteimonas suaedae]|uniref:type II toxin-antitoxin system VapB family antitoxin n=1 Tax=Luteimonas suaedae TaxID=2605430 RepID=UPI003CCDF70F